MTWHERADCRHPIDTVTFTATCRLCGSPIRPLAEGRTDGVVSWLPVQCVKDGCNRNYVVRTEMLRT